jgi:DNA-binding IclR family transcriptional regulator
MTVSAVMESSPRRGGRPASGEAVLVRAFRVLDAFAADEPALTLTRLSEKAGIPLSSTLRLVQQLVRLGAVERLPNGTFTVGIRLLEYAALAPRGHGLRAIALPYLEDLHRATRQHVQLGIREGDEGVIVERLSSPQAGKVLYYAGGRIPLHGTGIGLVLLAHARKGFQEAYLSRDLTVEPGSVPLLAAQLREQLQNIRATGVARFSRVLPEPAETIAAPIFDRAGQCVAAIAVLAATGSVEPRAVEPAVIAISRAISRDLSRTA